MKKTIKKCENPVCDESFESKNPKKKFCDLECKNKAAYVNKLEIYDWEVKKQRARQKNIIILEDLIFRGFSVTNEKELKKMGFDSTAAHAPIKDKDSRPFFRYGNLGMRQSLNKEIEIFHTEE